MSYIGSSAQTTVLVEGVGIGSISISVKSVNGNPGKDFTWGGNSITVEGYVRDENQNGIGGVDVEILYPRDGEGSGGQAGAVTSPTGYYSAQIVPGYGRNYGAEAYAEVVEAPHINEKVHLPLLGFTRIASFQADPPKVQVDDPVTFTGYLEWESNSGVWSAVAGKAITVEAQGAPGDVSGVDTTNTTGRFTVQLVPSAEGTWVVTAYFDGDAGLILSSSTITIKSWQDDLKSRLPLIGLPLIVGTIIYMTA
jgi:hypothetical protein